ncbi:MAG: 6-carboxytetrahydropterin synthase [Cryobacterium sp.]|nr:6-carboxytetrahydropterin synthase [Oligoflexia bacterium]
MSLLFKTKLILYFDFEASHSLDVREEPHPHLWKTTLTFTGEPLKGRIIDFPALESAVQETLSSLPGCYLNENADLLTSAMAFPTCESLGESIFTLIRERAIARFLGENPSLELLSVQVTLIEGDRVYGSAVTELRSS